MPIYEYQCPKCHQIFEDWTKVSEMHAKEPCPNCGALSPKLMSHTSFVLKGDGWYVSDYGYRKGIKEETDEKVKSDTESDKTSDTSKTDDTTKASDNKNSNTTDVKKSEKKTTPKKKTKTKKND